MNLYEMEPFEFNIQKTLRDDNGDYHFILSTCISAENCPSCGNDNIIRFGNKQRKIRDINMFGHRVELLIDNPRYKCNDCNNLFHIDYKSIRPGQRMTNRLRKYIKEQSLHTPFSTLADDLGLSDTVIKTIFQEHIAELDATRELKAPKVLGIDENHLHKHYRAIFTDVENGRIIEILPDRSKFSIKTFIQSLPGWKDIKCFTMDMWNPYKEAVYELNPSAIIVVDKFHVITKLNGALESIRKKLRAEQGKVERKHFRNSRFNLLKNMEDLDFEHQSQLLDFFESYPDFKVPYFLKEAFRDIYNSTTKSEAVAKYQEWKRSVSGYAEFEAVADTVDRWHTEIFNYFLFRYTNAVTESLNKLINDIDNLGRGYTFEVLRAKALYGTKATKPAKFKSITKWPSFSTGAIGFMTSLQTETVLVEGWGVDIGELQTILDAGKF